MRRIALAAAVIALAGALVASVGAGTPLAAKRNAAAAPALACTGGSVAAVIGGKNVCLKAGQKCKARYEPVYKRLGFHCAGGHLRKVATKPKPKPSISIADTSGNEGNSGTTPFAFTVSLSAASSQVVSVHYATADGTATAPADYASASGTLTFSPGQTSKTVNVSVVGDTLFEQDEAFTVTLSNPVNATIAGSSATGTIKNDDAARAKPGHYQGPITSGGFVTFDVSPDGSTVSNLVIAPYLTCSPTSGSGVYQLTFDSTSTIQPDLTFSANGTGTGVTVSFNGKFTGDGSLAGGTLQIHESYDDNGTHYECDSGNSFWAAVWKS
jgi:hypothetical protein